MILRSAFFVILLALVCPAAHADEREVLKWVDVEHPFCETPSDLRVAGDYFEPVGNDLPGVREYNDLVRSYQKKDWAALESGLSLFHKQYESSPLQEAAAFLYVQSKFERAGEPEGVEIKEAEKLLREAILLYPKSTLIPVLSSTVADYWLRNRQPEKSLSMYEAARRSYPFSPLACVFQMGLAESSYFLRDFTSAKASFNQLLQKCQNPRLRAGAEMRLIDASYWEKSFRSKEPRLARPGGGFPPSPYTKPYEALYDKFSTKLARFYPSALYNVGEFHYQSGNFVRARFFFEEYAKTPNPSPSCLPYAQKRLADISLRTGEATSQLVGAFMSVKERSSQSDAGLFSEVTGLLLELTSVSEPEYTRRIRVSDEAIEKISDEALRSAAYLDKGLITLARGEEEALNYLIRLNERVHFNLDKGPIAGFVRESLLRLLEKKISEGIEHGGALSEAEMKNESELLETIEQAHTLWLTHTKFEARGRELYARLVLHEAEAAIQSGVMDYALNLLKRWKTSALWHPSLMSPSWRKRLTLSLVKSLVNAKDRRELSLTYLKEEEDLKTFLSSEVPGFLVAIALEAGDDLRLKKLLSQRKPASEIPKDKDLGADVKDYLSLVYGESFAKLRKYAEAENYLLKVKEPTLLGRALEDRFHLYQMSKQPAKAYDVAVTLFEKAPAADKKEKLSGIYHLAFDAKLWKKAPELLGKAKNLGVEGKDLAPYHYFSGRAFFEQSQCKPAVTEYETALTLDAAAPETAEAKYRLGKCLVRLHKKEQARRVWEELAKMKDSFWSPLAQNEIRTL